MIVFISGTGTGIGKTYINMRLNALLIERNLNIISIKPIETGVDSNNTPRDALLHAQNQSTKKDISEICFYTFALPAAPFVADSQGIIDLDFLKNKIRALEKQCDILMIEGAGGLFVPIKKDYFFIDLIKDLGCESLESLESKGKSGESKAESKSLESPESKFHKPRKCLCVLISNDKLGCIDAILSHTEALERRNIDFISIVNVFDEAQFLQVSYPFLRDLKHNFVFQTQGNEILDFITKFINS